MSGVLKFPILKIVSISRNWKNYFFLKKSRVLLVFVVLRMPHKYVRLFTICDDFYMVSSNLNFFEIRNFCLGGGGDLHFCEKLELSENFQNTFFLELMAS
jgi:hypothetical protein